MIFTLCIITIAALVVLIPTAWLIYNIRPYIELAVALMRDEAQEEMQHEDMWLEQPREDGI